MKFANVVCATVVALFCFSCSENQLGTESNVDANSTLVVKLESGAVHTDGKQMLFENSTVYGDFKMKIQQDSLLRGQLEERYSFLLVHEARNSRYTKKYLFNNLSFGDLYSLNGDGAMVMEKSAMKFDSLYQYVVPVAKAALLNSSYINNPSVIKNKYHEEINASNARIELNGKDARWQKEYAGPSGQPRKFVHEVFTNRILREDGLYTHELILNHKHEYKGGGNSWYLSSEPRSVTWNVNYDGYFFKNMLAYNFGTPPVTSSGFVANATYQVAPILQSFVANWAGGDGFWKFEVRGTLKSWNSYTVYENIQPNQGSGLPLW